MSRIAQTLGPDLAAEQTEVQQGELFRTIVLITIVFTALVALFSVVLHFVVPELPVLYVALDAVGLLSVALLSLELGRRDRLSWATTIYLTGLTIALYVAIYLLNGVSGPMATALLASTVAAGLLGGMEAAGWVTLANVVYYIAMVALERTGILQPVSIPEDLLWLVEGGYFTILLPTVFAMTMAFVRLSEQALSVARERRRRLVQERRRAEEAAQAEREARARQEEIVRGLRQVVQKYGTFLRQISAGDYDARLDVVALDGSEVEGTDDLRVLGEYINETVETLVGALEDMQVIQQRYLLESWEGFGQRIAQQRFRLRGSTVEPDDEAWLASMTEAVQEEDITVDENELALPITLRGEVLGAIGARRDGAPWSEEEVALMRAVVDQLSQTIEGMRLLDETQRRAARERLLGEITGRMRESLDMDTVLRTAVRDIREAMDLPAVTVRLAVPSERGQE